MSWTCCMSSNVSSNFQEDRPGHWTKAGCCWSAILKKESIRKAIQFWTIVKNSSGNYSKCFNYSYCYKSTCKTRAKEPTSEKPLQLATLINDKRNSCELEGNYVNLKNDSGYHIHNNHAKPCATTVYLSQQDYFLMMKRKPCIMFLSQTVTRLQVETTCLVDMAYS